MRTETTVRELYRFDELTEDAQQVALDEVSEREYEWLDSETIGETITETLGYALTGAGGFGGPLPGTLKITGWDCDRGQSLDVEGSMTRDDAPAFPWPDGVECATFPRGYGWGEYVLSGMDDDGFILDATEEQTDAFDQAWSEVKGDALKAGQDAIEYAGSEENARDRIELDDMEFTADGTIA